MNAQTLKKANELKEEIRELDSFLITLRNIRKMKITEKYRKTFFKTIPCGYWTEESYEPAPFIKEIIYKTLEQELERMEKELIEL